MYITGSQLPEKFQNPFPVPEGQHRNIRRIALKAFHYQVHIVLVVLRIEDQVFWYGGRHSEGCITNLRARPVEELDFFSKYKGKPL
jgi:hypothetical protein